MSSSTPSQAVFSQAVQSIIKTKSAELHRKHALYKSKTVGLTNGPRKVTLPESVRRVDTVVDLKIPFANADSLNNITRFLSQAKYDSSVSETQLEKYNVKLGSLVDQQNRRLKYAKLYSAILTEHLEHESITIENGAALEQSPLDESYEVLEHDRLEQLRQKFDKVVFSASDIDGKDLQHYLTSLFSTDSLQATLKGMQKDLNREAQRLWNNIAPFNADNMDLIMTGLIQTSMLKNEKKALLKTFQHDPLLIEEICDVLNMRWTDLSDWSWTHDGNGLQVEPRRQLNGKYRIVADEDILDAIFLHYIGIRLCEVVKPHLTKSLPVLLPDNDKNTYGVSEYDVDQRKFYLNQDPLSDNGGNLRGSLNATFFNAFFLSHLPASLEDLVDYDDDEEGTADQRTMVDLQQQLLRHIAAEVQMRLHSSGDVAVVQTDLKWFATSIPHSTILTVLRFLGLPQQWLDFFQVYLQTPLNMGGDQGDGRMRKRMCGIPMAHSLEKFFGEMVLLCMDFAVRLEADVLLYRMHDDIFFYGTTAQCEKAWTALEKFLECAGLELNLPKTGSVFISKNSVKSALPEGDVHFDFLKLTSDGSWTINQESVNCHVKQLGKQLSDCKDVLSFIQTYNSCIGRFFGHTFGSPAGCFGAKHIDDILQVHQEMQQELFGDRGVCGSLKDKLKQLAQEQGLDIEPSDAFIFTPVALGGLGVVNPFLPLLLTRSNSPPAEIMEAFIRDEKLRYEKEKQNFETKSTSSRKSRYHKIFNNYDTSSQHLPDMNEFFSFEEYVKDREVFSKEWKELYEVLTAEADTDSINLSLVVKNLLEHMPSGIREHDLTRTEKYTLQLFADELLEEFGTLRILDRTLVPVGVVSAILKEKVTWQMVL